jgi:hypothetical protein
MNCAKCGTEMRLQNETLTDKFYVCPKSSCNGNGKEPNWFGNTVKIGVPLVGLSFAMLGIHLPFGQDGQDGGDIGGHGGGQA